MTVLKKTPHGALENVPQILLINMPNANSVTIRNLIGTNLKPVTAQADSDFRSSGAPAIGIDDKTPQTFLA
ncbi:hypothetical protein MACH16_02990 [Marinomonas pontica]|uniref:Uncharacterized protein n=1 Tax=Marinomonas pontica TaxID=264739 RepID=A0ABN6WI31_9GAMM|nr:hypothetical protein MACH16_02990 [Marinomonas pontica]